MILDLETLNTPLPAPGVLVLGAGAAGIVLTVALARKGVPVLLCETGGRSVEQAAQTLNDADVVGRKHTGVFEGRARILGGTTTLWGGQLISFRDIDFKARPWLGVESWPIDRSVLAPHYEAVAEMLGLPIRSDEDAAVWDALKLTPPDLGEDFDFVLTRWLKETNLARMFRNELETNPNITVLLHATATQLSGDGKGALDHVRLRSPKGREIEVEAERYVNAAGTIEACRLMLSSGQSEPSLPWANNPWVGTGFQDHLDLRVAGAHPIDAKRFHDAFDNIFLKGYKYNPKIAMQAAVQREKGLTNVGGVFVFESSVTEHLSNLKIFLRAMRNGALPPNLSSMPAHFKALAKIWWPLIMRYLRDNRAFNPSDLGISLRLHCEQKPMAQSRITLDPQRRDSNGMPRVVLDWQIDGCEIEAIATFCEILGPKLEEQGLARLEIDPRVTARDASILDEARDTNHHCGGLRMSADPSQGVVDANLKVHGCANLYVASAAVYPSSSFANPTFTSMALALRLANHLASSLTGHGGA